MQSKALYFIALAVQCNVCWQQNGLTSLGDRIFSHNGFSDPPPSVPSILNEDAVERSWTVLSKQTTKERWEEEHLGWFQIVLPCTCIALSFPFKNIFHSLKKHVFNVYKSHPLPPSNTSEYPYHISLPTSHPLSFFFVISNPLGAISAAHLHTVQDCPLGHAQPIHSHVTKGEWLSLSQQPAGANNSSNRKGMLASDLEFLQVTRCCEFMWASATPFPEDALAQLPSPLCFLHLLFPCLTRWLLLPHWYPPDSPGKRGPHLRITRLHQIVLWACPFEHFLVNDWCGWA